MSDTTCTHHPDSERTACPVCLFTALTAERDQLRAEVNALVITKDKACAAAVENKAEADGLRAEVKRRGITNFIRPSLS